MQREIDTLSNDRMSGIEQRREIREIHEESRGASRKKTVYHEALVAVQNGEINITRYELICQNMNEGHEKMCCTNWFGVSMCIQYETRESDRK